MKWSWCWAAGCIGLAMAALACGGDGDQPESPDAGDTCPPSLSYALTARPFVERYCLTCHSPGSPDRHGAPAAANFDSLAGIRARGEVMHTFVQEGRMPPPEFPELPQPSAQERDTYVAWLECSGSAAR